MLTSVREVDFGGLGSITGPCCCSAVSCRIFLGDHGSLPPIPVDRLEGFGTEAAVLAFAGKDSMEWLVKGD